MFPKILQTLTAVAAVTAAIAEAAIKSAPSSNASGTVTCQITKTGVLGMWDSSSNLPNSIAYNLSLSGRDPVGNMVLVTLPPFSAKAKKPQSQRFNFFQCQSAALPQPSDQYFQFGQIRPEGDDGTCLSIAGGGTMPAKGRFIASPCVSTDNATALAPQWFEYDFYSNIGFFQGAMKQTLRTNYRYSRDASTSIKLLRVVYSAKGLDPDTEVKTALRIAS